jgi:hypothetical protein
MLKARKSVLKSKDLTGYYEAVNDSVRESDKLSIGLWVRYPRGIEFADPSMQLLLIGSCENVGIRRGEERKDVWFLDQRQ